MNRAKQWLLSKRGATTPSLPLEPSHPEPQPLSIYQGISNLPLSRFIDCIVDGNLYALVITGIPDQKQLQTAWANILQDYSEAIGAGEYKLYISLYKEISLLKIDYDSIYSIVDALRSIQEYILSKDYEVDEDFYTLQKSLSDSLNKILKISCRFNTKDNASYQDELDKCIRRSGGLKIRLDLKLLAFAEIEKKTKGGKKMDRAYFDSMLITISDHAKYEIGENITVSKYCERIKRYNQYCESLKRKK